MLFEIIGVTKGWYGHGYGWNVMKTTNKLSEMMGLKYSQWYHSYFSKLDCLCGTFVRPSVCLSKKMGNENTISFRGRNCFVMVFSFRKLHKLSQKCWYWQKMCLEMNDIIYTHIFLYYIIVVGWYQSTYSLFVVLSLQC